MPIGDFDYIRFAKDLKEQVPVLLPADLENESEKYITETLYAFTILAGQALCNEETLEIEIEEAKVVCQLIAEWTFHKGVDLAHSKIPQEYWDSILQKIAFTVFEVAKQGIERKIPTIKLIQAVEHNVNKTWKRCINDLLKEKVITPDIARAAKGLSNIDVYSSKTNDDVELLEKIYKSNSANKKLNVKVKMLHTYNNLKLFLKENSLVILGIIIVLYISQMVYRMLYKINILSIITENINFMNIIFLISLIGISAFVWFKSTKHAMHKELNKLQKIKNNINELSNPDNMYERLGVETVMLEVGESLISMANSSQNGTLLPKIAVLRQELTDELGYIVPNVRIIDNSKLEPNEYTISIRGNIVSSNFVYLNKVMISSEEWHRDIQELPKSAIVGVNPIYQTQVYWVDKEEAKNKNALDVESVIIKHLKSILIKNVENIMTSSDVQKLINYVNQKEAKLFEDIKENGISEYDLQKIFANLIKEQVSIKDIVYIFEKLADISRYSKNTNVLTEQLRTFLSRQISLKNADRDHILYAVSLSPAVEKMLEESILKTEMDVKFNLNPAQTEDLICKVKSDLVYFKDNPVILCKSSIRLPLFQLLERYIPAITVIAYNELTTDVKVESLHVIGEEA